MADAIDTAGGVDPDRGSFTVALQAARDLLTQAAGVIAETVIDPGSAPSAGACRTTCCPIGVYA